MVILLFKFLRDLKKLQFQIFGVHLHLLVHFYCIVVYSSQTLAIEESVVCCCLIIPGIL